MPFGPAPASAPWGRSLVDGRPRKRVTTPEQLPWLNPPYQYIHPHPHVPFDLPVVRYEVGLSQRDIESPPYSVVKPTIRFHLPLPFPADLLRFVTTTGSSETTPLTVDELTAHPYVDFTQGLLIQRILRLYSDLTRRVMSQVPFPLLTTLEALVPAEPRPLVLAFRRLGTGMETQYDVRAVEEL